MPKKFLYAVLCVKHLQTENMSYYNCHQHSLLTLNNEVSLAISLYNAVMSSMTKSKSNPQRSNLKIKNQKDTINVVSSNY